MKLMNIYTIEDFKSFKRDIRGRFVCPSGDYTQIKYFGEQCVFAEHCEFGKYCHFEAECIFSNNCHFGEHCEFGKYCHFGENCNFGAFCHFGNCCRFGELCGFGESCNFGMFCHFGASNMFRNCCSFDEHCNFGESCNFDERCHFDERCVFSDCCNFGRNLFVGNLKEPVERVFKIDRIGSYAGCVYFFKTARKIYARWGCFFGTITEFEKQVNKTHGYNEQKRKEYIGAIAYVKSIM